MTQISPETLAKLEALNHWLERVYGDGIRMSTLLEKKGLSEENIQTLKSKYLPEYLEAVLDYIQINKKGENKVRQHSAMLRYYGLITGQKETLQQIADDFKVSRERIRQLKNSYMKTLRHPVMKAKLRNEFAAIACRLLEIKIEESEDAKKVDWIAETRERHPRAYESGDVHIIL